MECFNSNSVEELQDYLKTRGVQFSGSKKADLIELCELARNINLEVDPDGLLEDREDVLIEKLKTDDGLTCLTPPQLLPGSPDLSIVLALSIFDIYNYLVRFDEFDHSSLRNYYKLEGYSMFKDGYVLKVESVNYNVNENGSPSDYVGVKSNVKPRTNDKDPITKLGYYRNWIIMKKNDAGSVHSAYCTCKGGIDGCCRDIVATLFEVLDYVQDWEKTSCTSVACNWVRRSSQAINIGKPVTVDKLETSVLSCASVPKPSDYMPLTDEFVKPDPEVFLDKLKRLHPSAVILTSKFNMENAFKSVPSLNVSSPMEKLENFVKSHSCPVTNCDCVNIFIDYYLCYTSNGI